MGTVTEISETLSRLKSTGGASIEHRLDGSRVGLPEMTPKPVIKTQALPPAPRQFSD